MASTMNKVSFERRSPEMTSTGRGTGRLSASTRSSSIRRSSLGTKLTRTRLAPSSSTSGGKLTATLCPAATSIGCSATLRPLSIRRTRFGSSSSLKPRTLATSSPVTADPDRLSIAQLSIAESPTACTAISAGAPGARSANGVGTLPFCASVTKCKTDGSSEPRNMPSSARVTWPKSI